MTSDQMPSASGVRIAGDDYQWLHAWRICMEALHENFTGNSTNPTVAVGVEAAGLGNADDVVTYRLAPPHTYMQVKYAADHRTAVNLEYLDAKDILRNFVATHQKLTADGTPVVIRLISNRDRDPNDLLLKDHDGRTDGGLMPRAGQGGPGSDRGKARAQWATAATTDETTLLAFLRDFRLDLSYDLDRLRKDVSLLMTANGLRSDPKSVNLGADWVAQQVIAGNRRLTLNDIQDAITVMDLQAGSPWTTISVATIKPDKVASQAAFSLDWTDRIDGDTPWNRIAPIPPATWEDLAAEIRGIPDQLGGKRRILVSGHIRQATGFLIGTELRRVLNYEIGVQQGDQLWTGNELTQPYPLTVDTTNTGTGTGTAIIVNVAADAARHALAWAEEHLSVSQIITLTPAIGVGPAALPNPQSANSLATTIRDLAREHASAGDLHLFLIGPLGLAVLLGHHWNRVTTTHVYEHLGGIDYARAFTVDA